MSDQNEQQPNEQNQPDEPNQANPAGQANYQYGYQQGVVPPGSGPAGPSMPAYGPPYAQPQQPFVQTLAHAGERPKWRRRTIAGIATLAIAGATALGGFAIGYNDATSSGTSAASSGQSGGTQAVPNQNGLPAVPGQGGYGGTQQFPWGSGRAPGGSGGSTTSGQTQATAAQQKGLVTIDTVVDYGQAKAAGSGIILTSDGVVLTNHHVVEGATSITVTDESTGTSYKAEVVGTDATQDVAVLKLQNASGLTPATIDHDDNLAVGDTVTTVGNSNGGGELMAATGNVTALNQTITAGTDASGQGETLTGLIQANVDVVSGDSGGAMLDSQGEVVGMTTAASTGTPDVTGYAIDIDNALNVAQQIESGNESGTVSIGPSAFLGVMVGSTGATGATISGTVDGSPAAKAGLAAGDTITAVGGTRVSTAGELSAALAKYNPGDHVKITWTTSDGSTRTATVTLVEGPVA